MADARVTDVTRLIDGLRRDRRQHPLRGRGEYSARVQEVAGAIADMNESGRAADAVPLARRAVERVTAAMLHMDDSSGIIGLGPDRDADVLAARTNRNTRTEYEERRYRAPESLISMSSHRCLTHHAQRELGKRCWQASGSLDRSPLRALFMCRP